RERASGRIFPRQRLAGACWWAISHRQGCAVSPENELICRNPAHNDVKTMKLAAIVLVLLGCAGTQRPPAGKPASAFAETAVKARSHAFYAAIDRFDSADLTAAVAPNSRFTHGGWPAGALAR